ncbi:MAG: O-methyltransferase [Leptospira sp.]|nr:O-methyltransferase [Leptospira sp.]
MKPRPSVFVEGLESHIDENFVKRPNDVFYAMEEFAKEKNIPILSPASSAVLSKIVSWTKPKRIFEFGTGLGYSTLWMFYTNPNLEIVTIDRNESQSRRMYLYAEEMGLPASTNIELVVGDVESFLDSMKLEPTHFDFFFIDCDKILYPKVFDFIWKRANPGTNLVFDNMLWHGRILNPDPKKPSDSAVLEIWNQVKSLDYTLFPVGDGLLHLRK